MDAILLAAGDGTRFFSSDYEVRPLPCDLEYPIPKCLYPVSIPSKGEGQKPILEHVVEALVDGGIEKIYIGTGLMHEKIETFVNEQLTTLNIEIIPPNPEIDYRKGPLYTLAGVLKFFVDNGILTKKGFDRIVMLSPADLVIDRRAPWFIAGIPAREMMASRSRLHVMVENRGGAWNRSTSSALSYLIPERFTGALDESLLACPVVPLMAVHVDILVEAIGYLNKGATKFAEFLKTWIDENIIDEHQLAMDINIITTTYLGESFYWQDIDTFDSVKALEGDLGN
ncbi:MAG TPA: hypothetical protein VKM55_23410 [Candidatus Lokiarchaeia archaeon]|nr:hypothetical protein [Candidatus Lokiarchaeia archaeon]